MKNDLKIAAVVVTYNRKELLKECLQALLNQTRGLDEIIVIDNASTDGTEQMVRSEFPQVTYVRLPENIGGAGGFHEGMKLAYEKGHDWIWVMDDDAEPANDALEQLLKPVFLQNEEIYALASAVITPEGILCLFTRRFFDFKKVCEYPVPLEHYVKESFETDTVSFVGMLVSRRAIAEFGLPEKAFFIYYDDTEYSLRIRAHGGKILTIPSSRIVHKARDKNSQKERRRAPLSWRTYYGLRNKIYSYKKYKQSNVQFYLKIMAEIFKLQAGIILFREHKFVSTLILWKSLVHGLRGKLGKTIPPSGG